MSRISEVTIDFETRSTVDLRNCGAFVYAADPGTEAMCMSITVENEPPLTWVADKFLSKITPEYRPQIKCDLIPAQELIRLVSLADKVVAQNSMFEFLIWNVTQRRHGWPALEMEKLHDTMAQFAYHALPLSLDRAAGPLALNLPVKKDKAGHKIMLKMCKPRRRIKKDKDRPVDEILWHESPQDLVSLINYCCDDVLAERCAHHYLPDLPDSERRIWLLDQKINLRGVHVDSKNIEAIVALTSDREAELLTRFQRITGGAVSGPRSPVALRHWVNSRMPGINLNSVDANSVKALLKKPNVPEDVRAALTIKAELGKSSVSKFKTMLACRNGDNRVRGTLQYGAASTLRWGGRKIQPHNHPRDSYKPKDWDYIAQLFVSRDTLGMQTLYDEPFFVASRCIRGATCAAPGNEFICSDYSSVESVGNAYLADEQTKLNVFRNKLDPYKTAATDIFNKQYEEIGDEDPERQVGKAADLALGFGGGIGAFASMARTYGIDLETLPAFVLPHATVDELTGRYGAYTLAKSYLSRTEDEDPMSYDAAVACDVIKRKWRASHPNIVAAWKGYEKAAYQAVENPGMITGYKRIKYVVADGFLKCLMPSGRLMQYFRPSISNSPTDWNEDNLAIHYWGLKVADGKTTRQWTRLHTYGGKLCENIVQGFARDLLAYAMLRIDPIYPIVMHVHDEAVAEVPKGTGDLNRFNELMIQLPPWAHGMPIAAKGWIGKRYRK